jgi:hypothetical protein
MNCREIIAGLGSAVAWPVAARAQQPDRVRRIGVLMQLDENDPIVKPRLSAFTEALADLGWIDNRNLRMDVRWYGDDTNRISRALAQELVSLQPDADVMGHKQPPALQKKDWVKARHTAPTGIRCRSSRRRSLMRRREFIAGLGSATAWSRAALAQQAVSRDPRRSIR